MSQLFSARDTWTVLTIHTILLHQRLGRMLSVGYHLLVLLQRPQQQQESTCCCDTRCCCQNKNVMLSASPRRQGVSSVHPQRYEGFDPTFPQDKASCYILRLWGFARNASYERCCAFSSGGVLGAAIFSGVLIGTKSLFCFHSIDWMSV